MIINGLQIVIDAEINMFKFDFQKKLSLKYLMNKIPFLDVYGDMNMVGHLIRKVFSPQFSCMLLL